MCYAIYKGDEFIDLGSRKYLADKLHVKPATITFYMSPTYKSRGEYGNRYLVIKIEEDHNNVKSRN